MATLKKINPLLYITDRDPIPEKVMDSSAWFLTETMELDFGEYVGRPDENVVMHQSTLAYYIGLGWYVDAVLGKGSGGKWISTAQAKASQSGNANSSSSANSSASSNASSSGKTKATDFSSTVEGGVTVLGTESSGSNDGNSSGSTKSTGSSSTSGSSVSTTEQDGGPYWYAWQRIRLKRRRMQSELVLKDMIESFTKAYNEGREINDERYDEIVSLYALMLSATEDEANQFSLSPDDFKPLAKMVTDAVKGALEQYKSAVGNLPDDWLKSRIDEINRKFDALIGTTKTTMVENGTYNGTVWPTTLSGIERQRQYALNDLKDAMVTTKIDAYGRIAEMTAGIGQKLLDCEVRIIEAMNSMLKGPTELRNTVFKWMLDFMERRDDDYPGLDKISEVAANLGFSDGATGGNP